MRKIVLLILLGGLVGFNVCEAYNISGCASYLNDGLYRKYKYMGRDGALGKVSTQKKGLSTKESSTDASSESSTASVDPKYTTRTAISHSQYTTSWGKCSGLGLYRINEQRDLYYAQNRDEILKEISFGQGEHLLVLAELSLCEAKVFDQFARRMKEQTEVFISTESRAGQVIDGLVKTDEDLAKGCYNFSGLQI